MADNYIGSSISYIVDPVNTRPPGPTTQSLYSIANNLGSTVDVIVRYMSAGNYFPYNITLTSEAMGMIRAFRTPSDSITGGYPLEKVSFDTRTSSDDFVEIRSNIIGSISFLPPLDITTLDNLVQTGSYTKPIWQTYTSRMLDTKGQIYIVEYNILPSVVETKDFVLHPGEALLIQAQAISRSLSYIGSTSNPIISLCNVMWEEVPTSASYQYVVSGMTKDKSNNPIGGCDLYLLKKEDDGSLTYLTHTQSMDTGEYRFKASPSNINYFVIARKEGEKNVFDITDFTLTAVNP